MDLKSSEDILEMLDSFEKVVLFGDSGCAQMCDVGGILQLEDMEDFLTGHDSHWKGCRRTSAGAERGGTLV